MKKLKIRGPLSCSYYAVHCVWKKGEEVTKELSITQMQTICELATLKCYYHNVAKLTKEKEVLWWDTSAEL